MNVYSSTIEVSTRGFSDVHDLTKKVETIVKKSELTDGIVTVFVPGSTASITTIEYESGAIQDLQKAIEHIAPQNTQYAHDARWGDGNGFAHVRAALLGPSLTVPFSNGELQLGTWQQIILIDFDNRARQRNVLVQVIGTK
jgi:secondary thiamine-phosphate synthase enzyme